MLVCQFCNKQFTIKSNLNAHQKTAKYCLDKQIILEETDSVNLEQKIILDPTNSDQLIECEYCEFKFTNHSNKNRHEKICTYKFEYIKTQYENKINIINNEHIIEIETIKNKHNQKISKFKLQIKNLNEQNLINLTEIKLLKERLIETQVVYTKNFNGTKELMSEIMDENINLKNNLNNNQLSKITNQQSILINNNNTLTNQLEYYTSEMRRVKEEYKDSITNKSYNDLLLQIENIEKKVIAVDPTKRKPRKKDIEKYAIYIMTNKNEEKQRRYKIGFATSSELRRSNLDTASSEEFKILHREPCKTKNNMNLCEKLIHNKLNCYRVTQSKEFFELPKDKEIEFFITIVKEEVRHVINV